MCVCGEHLCLSLSFAISSLFRSYRIQYHSCSMYKNFECHTTTMKANILIHNTHAIPHTYRTSAVATLFFLLFGIFHASNFVRILMYMYRNAKYDQNAMWTTAEWKELFEKCHWQSALRERALCNMRGRIRSHIECSPDIRRLLCYDFVACVAFVLRLCVIEWFYWVFVEVPCNFQFSVLGYIETAVLLLLLHVSISTKKWMDVYSVRRGRGNHAHNTHIAHSEAYGQRWCAKEQMTDTKVNVKGRVRQKEGNTNV